MVIFGLVGGKDDATGAEEIEDEGLVRGVVDAAGAGGADETDNDVEDAALEATIDVEILTLVVAEDDTGRVDEEDDLQSPNPFWHPVPQNADE